MHELSHGFALRLGVQYDFNLLMNALDVLLCDGCGQPASPTHVARRLQRLERTTRYRPVHIGTLLLGGFSPLADEEFLYSGVFEGEAGRLLSALKIDHTAKASESVLAEFQRAGYFLTHVLECPLEAENLEPSSSKELLAGRFDSAITRIRRSLKPKRVVLISNLLTPLLAKFKAAELNCPLILDSGEPFALDSAESASAAGRLSKALAVQVDAGQWP